MVYVQIVHHATKSNYFNSVSIQQWDMYVRCRTTAMCFTWKESKWVCKCLKFTSLSPAIASLSQCCASPSRQCSDDATQPPFTNSSQPAITEVAANLSFHTSTRSHPRSHKLHSIILMPSGLSCTLFQMIQNELTHIWPFDIIEDVKELLYGSS